MELRGYVVVCLMQIPLMNFWTFKQMCNYILNYTSSLP